MASFRWRGSPLASELTYVGGPAPVTGRRFFFFSFLLLRRRRQEGKAKLSFLLNSLSAPNLVSVGCRLMGLLANVLYERSRVLGRVFVLVF
ncbi:hypothetical protein ACJRO7_004948 [Eucalyptus globulus]|uniref:Uncharacterized protein n=1 Tax=Eucalyptus globulus TaxID=34317 RepID=A0ABD3IYC0_EUCGL